MIGQLYPNAKIVQWSVRWMGAVCRRNGYRLFFFCCYSLLEHGIPFVSIEVDVLWRRKVQPRHSLDTDTDTKKEVQRNTFENYYV